MKKILVSIICLASVFVLITQSNSAFASHGFDENGNVLPHCVDKRGCDFTDQDIPPIPNTDPFDPTIIAMLSVAVGSVAGAAGAIVKSKKSSKNKTKEEPYVPPKVPYDSSKGSLPKGFVPLLRPAESKPKTLWVEPPSPEADGIPYDDADEIPTPTSALEFTEYLSKHWDRLQNANWAKYFEDVSNCIIASGGALNTTKAWVKKVEEIQHGKALDLVEYEGISADDLLDYSENDIVQTKDVKGYAKVISWAIAEELFDKSVKVTKVNIMPPSVGEMIKKMTPTPFKVLQFLVDYFGENITDSYSCLWASFKKLPVNSRPDNSINIPDQPDTGTGWKGV